MVWTPLLGGAHALVDPHARVFDANIYHPAPAQLTGSENLFFLQVLLGPLYLLTGRPLVATAIVTFLTYPLAALAMAALLAASSSCARLFVAWVCGLVFAVRNLAGFRSTFTSCSIPIFSCHSPPWARFRARSAPGWKSALWLFAVLLGNLS